MKGMIMKKLNSTLTRVIFLLAVAVPGLAWADGSAAAGAKLANVCAACHGEAGISHNDLWPNLAGQKKDYLVKQILAFQSGDRKEPMMMGIVATLSPEDVQNVAAYFASLPR